MVTKVNNRQQRVQQRRHQQQQQFTGDRSVQTLLFSLLSCWCYYDSAFKTGRKRGMVLLLQNNKILSSGVYTSLRRPDLARTGVHRLCGHGAATDSLESKRRVKSPAQPQQKASVEKPLTHSGESVSSEHKKKVKESSSLVARARVMQPLRELNTAQSLTFCSYKQREPSWAELSWAE